MDLALTEEQAALVASFADLLAKHSSSEQVRAAEPEGFDPSLWEALLGIGVVEMAVPESAGGWGAGLLDLALVAEQVGAAVAPAPVIEAQVAARLLATTGVDPGERMTTVAVRPALGERATLVPAGAVADDAVVLAGDRLLLVALEDVRRPVANLAAAPLADVTVGAGATELVSGPAATKAFEAALDEWLVLTAGALVGMASSAHRVTCEYARERHTWGVADRGVPGRRPSARGRRHRDRRRPAPRRQGGVGAAGGQAPRARARRPWRSRSRPRPLVR